MYNEVKDYYGKYNIDCEKAMARVANIPISLHVWQADDVVGLEHNAKSLSGGIQTTGNYPYRARNFEEIKQDLSFALSLIPGQKRLNLHASYLVSDENVERDAISEKEFTPWVEFAKEHNLALDFNPTFFSHEKVKNNQTLSSSDEEIREFWVRHGKACRKIAAYFAKEQKGYSLCNLWIPDGFKDIPANTLQPRLNLIKSLDEIYSDSYEGVIDSVESKVFGIGLEANTVGSNEFYLLYAKSKKNLYPLLDIGHFHPTENVADKITALLPFFKYIPLHVTRPMRWDSDHVVRLTDEIEAITNQIISLNIEDRVLIGLDYFDASINRIIAWVTGARNIQKALLKSALTPWEKLNKEQEMEDFSSLLADSECYKTLPWGLVWDEYCKRQGIPLEEEWVNIVKQYEVNELTKRV